MKAVSGLINFVRNKDDSNELNRKYQSSVTETVLMLKNARCDEAAGGIVF